MDKDDLFISVLPEEDVELPNDKGTVRVRALTRAELHETTVDRTGGKNPNRARDAELRMVCYAMVDPPLNIKEVTEWSKAASNGEFQKVVKTIIQLSKVGDDEEEIAEAQRQAYDDFR